MRFAQTPAALIPLAFWACSESAAPANRDASAPTNADARAHDDAAGFADAAVGFDDASAGFDDASAGLDDAALGFDDAAMMMMGLDASTGLDANMGFDAAMFAPDATAACAYPPGAVEPMALNQVISPYGWPEAIDGMAQNFPLDLVQAHCNTDPNRDWAPYDVILFVSLDSY